MHLLGVLVPVFPPAPTHRRVAAQQPRLLKYGHWSSPNCNGRRNSTEREKDEMPLRIDLQSSIVRGIKPLLGVSKPSPAVPGKSYQQGLCGFRRQ
ncbi:uncharacterized protein P174DRAFT_438638, partial [Aspergillus novofumigatus IBT 16806]